LRKGAVCVPYRQGEVDKGVILNVMLGEYRIVKSGVILETDDQSGEVF